MPLESTRPESSPERLTSHEVRQRLQHERNSRLAQLQSVADARPSATDDVLNAQRSSAKRVLKEIDAAFERLDEGRYGDCQRCDRPIPVERLEILPYVRACVGCQHLLG
ncbi:TraR/DksA C4-type zinc finger protein [Streptomyces sp. DSM 42041]|uniref:TraR/DksA C4-type zinc finger protein n=1 Tax=Streptomyces hazeniae TaxID=3075538 RepID=A0ABU2NXS0_9ACTN|nr:TraR/DksA C4-type zinc finger protein [Streptomyces sp. DSM 42041]MDT0380978.1 TraR/DksA C4-type zinc finger protein [Streptomyces sp. DSM 42041]